MLSFSDQRLPTSRSRNRLLPGAVAASLAHALVIALVVWQAWIRLMPVEVEVPATIELLVGGGADNTGAAELAEQRQAVPPQAAPQAPAETPPQPQPPLLPTVAESELVAPQPPPPPHPTPAPNPASPPPQPQSAPTPPTPQPGAGVAGPAATIEKGAGVTASASALPGNVAPEYPAESELRRERGRVVLALHIDAEGRVTRIDIQHSSGSPRLDQAARDTALHWRYHPAFHNGQPVPSVVNQGVAFGF